MTRTPPPAARDAFGRAIHYVRISVTDRCDLRCTYCMPMRPDFLPKADLLSLEELERLCAMFIRQGVRRLRITGGEPLLRRGVMGLFDALGERLRRGELDEVTLTTNGVRLAEHAEALARAGVRRVNVSLDTLDRATFARIARADRLEQVLEGIAAARRAGLAVKLNTVALAGDNLQELPEIVRYAHAAGMTSCLIETMPVGEVEEDRTAQFVSLADVRRDLERRWTLDPVDSRPGLGPARYVRVRETGGMLGFITPISQHFCETCNRVRLTCTGRLYLCLGRDEAIDFRDLMRSGASDADLSHAYAQALLRKPAAHAFEIGAEAPAVARTMSTTGG